MQKNLQKSETKTVTESNTKAVETSTTTEAFTEPVRVESDSAKQETSLKELEAGPVTTKENGIEITTSVDKKTGKLHTKVKTDPKDVPAPGIRTTVSTKTTDTSAKSETSVKTSTSQVDRTTGGVPFNPNWLWLLLIPVGWWCWRKLR